MSQKSSKPIRTNNQSAENISSLLYTSFKFYRILASPQIRKWKLAKSNWSEGKDIRVHNLIRRQKDDSVRSRWNTHSLQWQSDPSLWCEATNYLSNWRSYRCWYKYKTIRYISSQESVSQFLNNRIYSKSLLLCQRGTRLLRSY